MLTAGSVRAANDRCGVLRLLAELGYAPSPVSIDAEQWRRAGVEIRWGEEAALTLVSRLRRFDLFLLEPIGGVEDAAIESFLRSYAAYNVLIKSAIVKHDDNSDVISIYDLSARRALRRLDVHLSSPTPHALDRLNLLAAPANAAALPRIFDVALDRENVSRRFFARFRDAVRATAGEVAICWKREKPEAVDAQALLILSRLLFLCFVQAKGWLNGERRFLFDRMRAAKGGFYAAVLSPLFFGCLNTPLACRDQRSLALGRIPYLNGGLFEPSAAERRAPELQLPDDLMRRVMEEVFERFDFSSDEHDAAGTHVDPEMLGKVFESLMAENERAASGSFYTSRGIVDVLTRRAICDWLAAGDERLRRKLEMLAAPAAAPPLVSRADAAAFLQRLEKITVLDPACGSGAFLLSALGVIETLTVSLSSVAGEAVRPRLRQFIVEHSLFGVDVKPEAVRLCELRLWLAIVSATDADGIEDVPPLPNLDRNILQGNSLLSPLDFLGDGRTEVYRDWIYALRAQADVVDRYRHASRDERPALAQLIRQNDCRLATELLEKTIAAEERELEIASLPQHDLFGRARPLDGQRCAEIHARIEEHRRAIESIENGALDFFAFDVHFAQVLSNGGFEVIAGNPPWVRMSRIDPKARRMYADRYPLFAGGGEGRRSAFHQPDLSIAFFERALSLAAPGGVVALLMPAKVANAGYASSLRRAASRLSIVALDDWSSAAREHFDADTFPLGITVAKRAEKGATAIAEGGATYVVPQHEISVDGEGSEWSLVPPEVAAILRRLRITLPPLAEALGCEPLMGVKTGDNSLFFLGDVSVGSRGVVTSDGLVLPHSAVARCIRGRDVRRWSAAPSEWIFWPPERELRGAPAWLARFARRRRTTVESLRLSYVRPEHRRIKVVWKDVGRGMSAAVAGESAEVRGRRFPLVPNQTLYTLHAAATTDAHAVAALLNSTVFDALVLSVAERAKDAHFRYFGRTIAAAPLPRVARSGTEWQSLAALSRQAHRGADVSREVDELTSRLYGVTAGELWTLRRFVEARLGS